jgi:hypothetical protein
MRRVDCDGIGTIQRKADNQIRTNLRRWIKEVDELAKARKVHRLILAGTPEITREFRTLLPARLAPCGLAKWT